MPVFFTTGAIMITLGNIASKRSNIASEVMIGAVLCVASMLAAWHLWGGRSLHISDPIYYGADGLLNLTTIRNLMESGWAYTAPRLGFPFGSSTYDYPIPDSGTLLVLKILADASRSIGFAYNAYYLAGFGLNAWFSYMVMRRLGLAVLLSFAGSFAFTMLPFHFMRVGHLFYTWYFAAPVFTWYALRAYENRLDFLSRRNIGSQVLDAIALLVLPCFGVYYAFFGAICIMTGSLACFFRTRSVSVFRGGVVACLIVLAGLVANVTPSIIYRHTHGLNHEVAARTPIESEMYGMKVTQLLLPEQGHRVAALNNFTQRYDAEFPLVNENATSSLGLIGSIGFVALLASLLVPNHRRGIAITLLGSLTLTMLIFCTIGGFSSLFAMLVSPMIRAWNRASVFIGFFSIAASMLLLQAVTRRFKPAWNVAVCIAIFAFVIWDQTSDAYRVSPDLHARYESDKAFTGNIERMLPAGSAIYQIPYMAYPEVPALNGLAAYDQAAGYLNSTSLRWSYGGMKGREGDRFFRQLSTQPLARQIDIARGKGFSGVWVDRRGYEDHGQKVEAELTRILGAPAALVSPNGNQSFFRF